MVPSDKTLHLFLFLEHASPINHLDGGLDFLYQLLHGQTD
jgi:hypothetical protein